MSNVNVNLEVNDIQDYVLSNIIISKQLYFFDKLESSANFKDLLNKTEHGYTILVRFSHALLLKHNNEGYLIVIEMFNDNTLLRVYAREYKHLEELKNTFNLTPRITGLNFYSFRKVKDEINYDYITNIEKAINSEIDIELFKLAGIDIHKLPHSFITSKSNLLIVLGPPGTGKSKLALTLPFIFNRSGNESKLRVFLVPSLYLLPEIFEQYSYLFFTSVARSVNIFIIDDLEIEHLKRGYDPQIDLIVNYLLKAIDGPVPIKNKFILTTNATIRTIDQALLRKGRLFAAIKLKQPTNSEVLEYLKSKGYDTTQINLTKDTYTIAEIIDVIQDLERSKLEPKTQLEFALDDNVVVKLDDSSVGF